ncbi:ribosomal protein L7/L12 [Paraburkholderia sp.]|uniref:ribosomal protein L7/L12 n=1 Tax=Paraburkholderia sp. TaxID=1926495 RepID=UPI003D6DACF9
MNSLAIVIPVVVVAIILWSIRRSIKRAREIRRTFETTINTTFGNNAFQSQMSAAIADAVAKATTSASAASAGFSTTGAADTTPVDTSTLGVAEVLSVSSLATGSPEAALELDAIGAPKRRVTLSVPDGASVTRGDRLYVVLDPNDPSKVSLAPASLTRGQTLPQGSNRLDALVLGPQILRAGTKAKGIVKTADSIPLAEASLASRGFSKWRLELEVTPERGWPYRAELTISLTTPEKAARIAHAGAEVPLRCDPDDPKTISIDSIEMGYGDPYEAVKSAGSFKTTTYTTVTTGGAPNGCTVVLVDSGPNLINVIKEVRELTQLSLKDAKDLVESAPQKLKDFPSADQADAARRRLQSAGATVAVV